MENFAMIRHFIRISQISHKRLYSTMSTPPSNNTSIKENLVSFRSFMDQKNKSRPEKPIVWVDCEMTGLDVFGDDNIIEICCLITNGNLEIVDEEGFESTIYYPQSRLDKMNEWCIETHGKSGLTAKVLANPDRKLEIVENELLDYIKKYVPKERTALLAGNSIHMDRFFMMKEFPKVTDHLHYRNIDVSTIMEVGYRHNPDLMKYQPKKIGSHTARSDILESIAQLKWYREHYLKLKDDTREFCESLESSPVSEESK